VCVSREKEIKDDAGEMHWSREYGVEEDNDRVDGTDIE